MAFPINYRPKGTTGATDYATWSWMQGILPYIEQANLYNTLSVSERMSLPNNLQVANTPIKTYLCPSDGLTRGGMMGGRSDSGGTKAVQNYKACSGAAWNWAFINTNNVRWGSTESNGLTKCDGLLCSNSQGTPPSDMSWVSKNMTRIATITRRHFEHFCHRRGHSRLEQLDVVVLPECRRRELRPAAELPTGNCEAGNQCGQLEQQLWLLQPASQRREFWNVRRERAVRSGQHQPDQLSRSGDHRRWRDGH